MASWKYTTILLLLGTTIVYSHQEFKVCAKRGLDHDCSQLARSNEAECEISLHGIECIHNIEHGRAHFGQITAEEAFIAANFVQDLVVIGEIRSDAIYDNAVYETVVLVRSNYTGGFSNLRGKQYCHPGFKYEERISELLLKEFEKVVLKPHESETCSSTEKFDTLAERELSSVHKFFGRSCRPGPWSKVNEYNERYYKDYSQLCDLCKSEQKCTIPNGEAPFMYSLNCLLDGGDVALTTLNTVKEYFDNQQNAAKRTLYSYLCRDGSVKSLDTPCTWSRQPWNLIVANKREAADIKSLIEHDWLPNNIVVSSNSTAGTGILPVKSEIEDPLEEILLTNRKNKISIVNELPLQNYITAFRTIPSTSESTLCRQVIRWCTISPEEQEECLWLSQASLDAGIQPVIDCVKSANKITCLEDIEKNKADVVTSDAHYGYIARKKGLAPINYPDTNPRNLIHTLLIIKSKDAGAIQKFGDLKDKKACLPEYGGIEWLSFINTGRNLGVFSKSCDYDALINGFIGDSCIPGTHDHDHEVSGTADKDKLCRLCLPIATGTAVTCNTDDTNQYYDNKGALKCLQEVGDFAVITKGGYPNIDPTQFRVICNNGTLARNTGFDVDLNCALSVTIDSEVVTKRNPPNKNKDIELVLLNIESHFGKDRSKAFDVFNVFNNKLDLLFKDSTPGVVKIDSDSKYVKNYAQLFAHTDECLRKPIPENPPPNNEPGGASSLQTSIFTIITTIILLRISKLL